MNDSPPRRPTIREVAKLAQVGLMTVSRVINKHPNVRPGTLKRVNSAIAALNYRENEAARLLKGRRAMTIGLIVPDLSDIFFASCAHTVQQIARQHGFMTLVACSERDSALEIQEAELMASRKVSGLLVVTSMTSEDQRLQHLQDTGMALVAMARPLKGLNTDVVVVENRSGAEAAVEHLIAHGHQRIVCLGSDVHVYTMAERIAGYEDAMRRAGLKSDIVTDVGDMEGARRWIEKVRKLKAPPTAIFSLKHRCSISLLKALSEAGLVIPADFALIGFDDFELASVTSPPVTTVSQSPVELTRRSMALMLERISNQEQQDRPAPAKIVLPVTLTIRQSCGCIDGKIPDRLS